LHEKYQRTREHEPDHVCGRGKRFDGFFSEYREACTEDKQQQKNHPLLHDSALLAKYFSETRKNRANEEFMLHFCSIYS